MSTSFLFFVCRHLSQSWEERQLDRQPVVTKFVQHRGLHGGRLLGPSVGGGNAGLQIAWLVGSLPAFSSKVLKRAKLFTRW